LTLIEQRAKALFSDTKEGRSGTIPINEFGAFLQAAKSLFNDHLKRSASIRYDKSQNFKGLDYTQLTTVGFSGLQELIRQMRRIESYLDKLSNNNNGNATGS
jgi:hypothetical protein